MSNQLAIVFCAHHKPWLMMSTLITMLAQDYQDADLYFLYNVGAGDRTHNEALTRNIQLSPFDERVRDVCRLKRSRVFEVEYRNDEALDSGAWYKFIRERRWMGYEWVLFVGEGTLFARMNLLSSMMTLARDFGAQVIASGHEKRRLPKSLFLSYNTRHEHATEIDAIHDGMIKAAFEIFCRDPSFRRIFDDWDSDFEPETQHHIPPCGLLSPLSHRLRSRWARHVDLRRGFGKLRELPWTLEYMLAGSLMWLPIQRTSGERSEIVVNGTRCPVAAKVDVQWVRGVGFHRVAGAEWFGCATNHLMSRFFLEHFVAKLDEFGMWDVLDLPFAGTALEVLWGFIPAWLGFEKWFTDGFHRVRKDFVTYRREDYPPDIAAYINSYYRSQLLVSWHGDYLKLRRYLKSFDRMTDELPAVYFV